VARDRGDLEKAEDYHRKALAIYKKVSPDSLDFAASLHNLGDDAWGRNNLARPMNTIARPLPSKKKLAPGSDNAAETFNRIGDVCRRRGDLTKAEEFYRKALAIREKLAPESLQHAGTLAALALVARQKQQMEAADQLYDQALHALEGQTSRLGGFDEQRAGFRAKHAGYYLEYIDLLMAQKEAERAFSGAGAFSCPDFIGNAKCPLTSIFAKASILPCWSESIRCVNC